LFDELITFRRFMEYCLYDPQAGYYRQDRKTIFGPKGDFFTSPYTHRLFADLLADALAEYFRLLGSPGQFDIVELGAGEDILRRQLTESLKKRHPEVSESARYTPIDLDRGALPWDITGIVFSNEFFDALPVHRVRIRHGELLELYVREVDGKISEEEGVLSDQAIRDYMSLAFPEWHEGWTYEVNLEMLSVLADLDRRVTSGFVVTLDYGYDWQEYDSAERSEGTLLCYREHQANTDLYKNPGEQDMTAHVNFDVLRKMGEEYGWSNDPLQTQRQFLMSFGLEQYLIREESEGLFNPERLEDRLGLKQLLIPGGISDTIKVMVQRIRTN
jgi:SAM-dependent MidA family methyltransferase